MNLDLFKHPTLAELACELEIHPFEAVRILSLSGPLPKSLRFTTEDLDRLRELGALEEWWVAGDLAEDAGDDDRLVALAKKLTDRDLVNGKTTRMDNLYRGLEAPHREALERLARRLLQRRVLTARATAAGMHVSIGEGGDGVLQRLADGAQADQELPGFWERAPVIELSFE